jgi:hypothetical protein
MPTEKELLALCLRWIEDSPNDAFDRAMLIDAVKAKLQPFLPAPCNLTLPENLRPNSRRRTHDATNSGNGGYESRKGS